MPPLIVLGATGSIGRQALEVATHLGWEVAALAARTVSPGFRSLAAAYPEADLAVAQADTDPGPELGRPVVVGPEAVAELAGRPGHVVVNGIVGAAGLEPTLAALAAGNRLALANKESLVMAGELVRTAWEAGGGELIPVDSEHSALHQCLAGERPADVARLILTASGGPFRGYDPPRLAQVTVAEALDHPTWRMGGRITIDSATLMNKGLEVIEAHHLFGVGFDRIDVVIHPQSVLHSAVELVDGSLKAHLGHPDMRIPIQYALTFPHRAANPAQPFTLVGLRLDFEAPDRDLFPALDLAYAAGRRGGTAPAVLNAADEVAVEEFLAGRLPFPAITAVVEETLAAVPATAATDLEEVRRADTQARQVARRVARDFR